MRERNDDSPEVEIAKCSLLFSQEQKTEGAGCLAAAAPRGIGSPRGEGSEREEGWPRVAAVTE